MVTAQRPGKSITRNASKFKHVPPRPAYLQRHAPNKPFERLSSDSEDELILRRKTKNQPIQEQRPDDLSDVDSDSTMPYTESVDSNQDTDENIVEDAHVKEEPTTPEIHAVRYPSRVHKKPARYT